MNTQIQSTVRDYVQAYLQADAELLAKAFHGETRLHSVSESGTLERTEMQDWLVNIRARKEKGDVRQGDFQLALLDQTGDSAVAKVVITLSRRRSWVRVPSLPPFSEKEKSPPAKAARAFFWPVGRERAHRPHQNHAFKIPIRYWSR